MTDIQNTALFKQVISLLRSARQKVVTQVNSVMLQTYFEIGRMIVEEEQDGSYRANYGAGLLKEISKGLSNEFEKGFSVDSLENMRKFYLVYNRLNAVEEKSKKPISETASRKLDKSTQKHVRGLKLSWSHYIKLMRIDDDAERAFYTIESEKHNWSVRELKRQYNSALYTRLTLSRDKDKIKQLAEKGLVLESPKDAIKDPYILEFIGLPEHPNYSEGEFEQAIIDKLELFLLELGTGFTFVARQKRISFEGKHFYIDLVFFNRILNCFVLIDLKIGELKHQDIGQIQMYVNYYDREIKLDSEQKTIGMILCQDKNEAVVRYTLPENENQIFASKYKTVLPSKEDLNHLIKEV